MFWHKSVLKGQVTLQTLATCGGSSPGMVCVVQPHHQQHLSSFLATCGGSSPGMVCVVQPQAALRTPYQIACEAP